MFKNLRNEARVSFWLHTAGPLLIKGPDQPGLDPLLPDMRFVRAWRNGKEVPYIPGSSLKGVLRSRAEQIVRALAPEGMKIPDPFERQRETEKEMKNRYKSGRDRYYASDPVTQLFGQTYLAGRLRCADAFPVEGRPLQLNERNHVAINRITGATQGTALFSPEAVEEGTFAAEISLTNFALWQLKLLGWLLQDLDEGYVLIGGSTTRGYGRVRVENVQVVLRDYRGKPPGEILRGYEDGDTVKITGCRFNRREYCWEAVRKGFEWLVNLDVDLVKELEKLHRKQKEVQQGRERVSHGG
ncbi:RAMP superfamily CRISPR-associated protein [Thermodesulfitimonas sp.]